MPMALASPVSIAYSTRLSPIRSAHKPFHYPAMPTKNLPIQDSFLTEAGPKAAGASDNDSHNDAPLPPPPADLQAFYAEAIRELGLHLDIQEPALSAVEYLDSGSTSTVNVAVDDTLCRVVAVKSLLAKHRYDMDFIERVAREAQATAQLEHPNIVPVHTLGISPSKGIYFTMKRLRGDSLRQIITQLALRNPAYLREYTHSRRQHHQKRRSTHQHHSTRTAGRSLPRIHPKRQPHPLPTPIWPTHGTHQHAPPR